MQRLGLSTAGDLARALDMPPYSESSMGLIRKWLRGDHGPRFETTMTLLSKAGLLTEEADRAWKGLPPLSAEEEARAAAAEARRARRSGEESDRRGRETA